MGTIGSVRADSGPEPALILELAQLLREPGAAAARRDGRARPRRRRRRRRRHLRRRRARRGSARGVHRRARARGWPSTPRTAAWSRPATPPTCWSSTRSTARGRRWPGSSRPAWRWRWRRSATASRRCATSTAGCVVEIKTGDWFLARRGAGVQSSRPVRLSANADARADVLGLRVPGAAGAADRRGARRADRRLLGRRRDVRARLPGVRDDPGRHRPARRRDRGRLPDDRRGPGAARRVRADRRRAGAQQLPLRPRRAVAVRDRGRRGRQRRLGRAARPPAAARLRPRVPDVLDHRRLPRAPRAARAAMSTRGIARLRAIWT